MSLEPDDDDLSVVAGYLAQNGVRSGLPMPPPLESGALGEPTSLVLLSPRPPADSPTGLSQAAASDLDDEDLLSGML